MEINEAKEKLMALQKKMSAYNHAMSLIYYDGVTTAPKDTAENRSVSLSILSEELYCLSTSEETVALLKELDGRKDELSKEENRMVYLLLKEQKHLEKIPVKEYVAYQELLVHAEDVWHRAKLENDFASFEPYLEQIFEMTARFAGYCAPDKKPYDYWLNEYEPGLSMESCDSFFSALRENIVPLLGKVLKAKQVPNEILHGNFPVEAQDRLSAYLMELIGLDMGHCGLSTTEHPFTTNMGSHLDERITTHYLVEDFSSSMFSVIHEGGHALYDMGSRDQYAYTVLDGGVSMGIHESQSRFYENILGRSRGFCKYVFPKLQELFPQLSGHDWEEFYRAVNRAEPSLIRTEADELTYCLHVMVRYELEKRVLTGELKVRDLPREWNRLYKEYLGVDVPNDSCGLLQDSHWSGGSIGYFPSYSFGSAYGAQLLHKMSETVDVEACMEKGDFAPINEWLRTRIWQFGALLEPGELLEQALGEKFDPAYYVSYLEKKVRDVYGI